ncbi:MAG: allophanate hydrolase [Verrucomicrobiales bacterium]
MTPSLDIESLRSCYAEGSLTPSDVVREVYHRIAAADSKIWIALIPLERTLEIATELEKAGPNASQPLWGIPFAVKDNIDVAGVPTTAGCPDFSYTPGASAHVVDLLVKSGAIPIGKTNLDQFATGLVGTRSPYGVPRNALSPDHAPGGSSSGSAVAVAAGLASFSLGTDTAGSGRIPAAFNNLVGLKPTRGWFSARGVVPACRSLDCVSVFGLTVSDVSAVSQVIGDFDPGDAFARKQPETSSPVSPTRRVFAVPREDQLEFFGDHESAAAFSEAIEKMKSLGWQELRVDFSVFADAAKLLYEGPWVAERYAAIRSFIEQSPDSLHPVTRAIIEPAIHASAVACFEACYRLAELKRKSEAIWEVADCLITPTAGTMYTIEEVENEPIKLNSNLGIYTNFMNLLDLCAIAVPAGKTSKGLPFGITIAAPAFADQAIAVLADNFHRIDGEAMLGATLTTVASTPPLALAAPAICELAVCGAHLKGLPLHHQLEQLGATFVEATQTAASYRLFALPGTQPAKPGMIRDAKGNGAAIEVEVYALSARAFGRFVHAIPAPLGITKIELADGRWVSGFACEASAIIPDTEEVTACGGWRAYLNTRPGALKA